MVGGALGGRSGCAQRLGYLGRFVLHRLSREQPGCSTTQRKSDEQVQTCNSCAPRCVGHPSRADVPVAHAVDGIVNFSGNITEVACDINGQAPGAGNVTNVDLGIVAPTHFTAVGTNSTFQEFDLVLSGAGCTNDKKVSIAFDQVTNVDRISGNLMLMGPSEARACRSRSSTIRRPTPRRSRWAWSRPPAEGNRREEHGDPEVQGLLCVHREGRDRGYRPVPYSLPPGVRVSGGRRTKR